MKEINNFPNYKIDRFGNVVNKNGLVLKQETARNGYKRVSLSNKEVKHKHMLVHRLVAESYNPNPNNYPQVHHRDEDRANNHADNLEWCTSLDNLLYSGIIDKASIAKFHKIICHETGEIFNSIKEACDKYNLHHSNLVACCTGRRAKCGGKTWSYYE